MPIPSTNITFTNIQTELGGTNPISLSEYYNVSGKFGFGITGIPTSGQININNFKGKSKGINVSITGTGNNIFTATDNSNYKYAFFANNGTFSVNSDLTCDILIVGGGGGGGFNNGWEGGGGGGAGGLGYGTINFKRNIIYNITIGSGGTGGLTAFSNGQNGSNTSIIGDVINENAYGGGGGSYFTGLDGGSGGGASGASANYNGGNSTKGLSSSGINANITYYGNKGGDGINPGGGGGGGGAGFAGNPTAGSWNFEGANGGDGLLSSITGTSTYYAGGGGGARGIYGTNGGNGGLGGGGKGAGNNIGAVAGSNNTGGGGGGKGAYDGSEGGASGGSGVIIIRYSINKLATITTTTNNYILTKNASLLFNYTNYSNINSGTYNISFLNGSITINSTPSINDKSYPILKDSSGIIINPTAWYKFDDSTNLGLDNSGNGYHLTNNNNVSIDNTNFIKGTSASLFNGGNNLQRAYTNNLFSDQAGWSLSFWVYLKKPADLVSLISTRQSDSSTLRGFNWYYNNVGEFYFQIGNDLSYTWYGFSFANFYTDNVNFKWFHLVLTIKSGEQRLYSNGILIGSYSISQIPNFQNGSSAFTIGSSSMNGYYVENGFRYDDVRYYGGGRILTQSQVTELYNGRIDIFST